MHSRDLIELAGQVATQSSALLRRGSPLCEQDLEGYWIVAKCRLDRWGRTLKQFSVGTNDVSRARQIQRWHEVRPTFEEILLSDVLARVWTAIASQHDRNLKAAIAEPIARSVLIGQMEARNRALNLLVYGNGVTVEEAVVMNRLRRRAERWNDLLLAHLHAPDVTCEFAFEPVRLREFADDLRDESATFVHASRQLLSTSLRAAFGRGLIEPAANPDLNQRLASHVLACFPHEHFDSFGLPKSLWLERMQATANDSQGLIEDLLAIDAPRTNITPWSAR